VFDWAQVAAESRRPSGSAAHELMRNAMVISCNDSMPMKHASFQ
jgi:hypothetical protein